MWNLNTTDSIFSGIITFLGNPPSASFFFFFFLRSHIHSSGDSTVDFERTKPREEKKGEC